MTYINLNTCLNDLFIDGKEAVFFRDSNDLISKIRYYNKNINKVRDIAQAGWAKGHSCYNTKIITKYMLDLVFLGKGDATWKQHIYR